MKLEEAKENLGQGVRLEMVLIPPGEFVMGGQFESEHEVTLTKAFYIGKYAVTQEQWEAVMGTGFLWFGGNPSRTKGDKLPVTDVSWEDCQEFIKKLNAKTDGGYRLPTEAEWEYACRAGTTTAYSFGDKITPKNANYEESNIGNPVAVGSYQPNAFGLYDMHGNVWEWCNDWSSDSLGENTETDPKGPPTGKWREKRGGAFNFNLWFARSSSRNASLPSSRLDFIGFRLARTADIKPAVAPAIPNPKTAEIMQATGDLLVTPFNEAKAKEGQKSVAKSLQKEVEEIANLSKGIKLEMVLIPAGRFKMGSPESENGRDNNETQHEVTLTKSYYIGKYEVTHEQWEAVMGGNPSRTEGDKLPVTDVSWEDCQEFIKKLNAKTNGGYRLPTEAEWEYACRAGTTTAYSFGCEITPKNANYEESNIGNPVAVGSYQPNAFGLYDMHGNVFELCEDWRADYKKWKVIDPKGPVNGECRVMRGGAFDTTESMARSSNRDYGFEPTFRGPGVGFRLARTP